MASQTDTDETGTQTEWAMSAQNAGEPQNNTYCCSNISHASKTACAQAWRSRHGHLNSDAPRHTLT